jgi:hypothetical protein
MLYHAHKPSSAHSAQCYTLLTPCSCGCFVCRLQGLRAPITDIWKLRSSDQRLYLQTADAGAPGSSVLVGGLKVGKKKLFIHRVGGQHGACITQH